MTDAQLVSTFALGKNTSRDRELLKIIVLGAANVGKTSMMKRYTTDRFIADRRPTVGADFMTKKVKVEGTDVILQLWDTAGQVGTCIKLHFIPDLKFNFNGYNLNYFQERFHHGTLGQHFYRGSNGCLLVYDITDRASLSQLVDWRDEAIARVDSDHFFPIIVVGNKIDLKQGNILFTYLITDLLVYFDPIPHIIQPTNQQTIYPNICRQEQSRPTSNT